MLPSRCGFCIPYHDKFRVAFKMVFLMNSDSSEYPLHNTLLVVHDIVHFHLHEVCEPLMDAAW